MGSLEKRDRSVPHVRARAVYGVEMFTDKNALINIHFLDETTAPRNIVHAHEYIQLYYIHRGKCTHTTGTSERVAVRGDAFVVPPMVSHSIGLIKGCEIQLFECEFMPVFVNENFANLSEHTGVFDFAYIEPFLVAEDRIRPRFNLRPEAQKETETLLFEMMEEREKQEDGYRLLLKADLLKLLVLLGREYRESRRDKDVDFLIARHRDAVRGAIDYIHQNYSKHLVLKDVYTHAMMSQSYFSRFFKELTRKTYVQYMNDLRVRMAMQLLRTSGKKVLDICHEVGYEDVAHFNRMFKKIVGVTPTRYRGLNKS